MLIILPSSTLTYLYKIGDLEEDLYVPYPAVSAVLRGVEEEEESRDGLKEAIEEELEAGEVFVLRRYFSRYFKVPTCSTLTYLYVRTLPRFPCD
ncbi:hypothetical protein L249_4270 [Ophiocordyceps polyrhachis-furcata BCC 54312]|uniref:Uncharacterized protein n=1 Tax=Ophiocordyceps polyrhachis-furcata BCC 54312 TaxID=1330021 RepID=A0A367L7P2_9HYPO|nr:hypothetical protein L249_4270 [Ophiocordyceps polyrhachis-furcata BCC 54312]